MTEPISILPPSLFPTANRRTISEMAVGGGGKLCMKGSPKCPQRLGRVTKDPMAMPYARHKMRKSGVHMLVASKNSPYLAARSLQSYYFQFDFILFIKSQLSKGNYFSVWYLIGNATWGPLLLGFLM